MNTELAAIIVHDIKNALGVLEGQLRELTTDSSDPRTHQAHLTCLNLQEKLIGFLTLYKASSQGLKAHIEVLSPKDFLTALADRYPLDHAGLSVLVNEEEMPVIAFFDENLVSLALEAALQNATRFAHKQIELSCRKQGSGVVFRIRDDGPGIGVQESKQSTGLGMDLCNAIANAHVKGDQHGYAQLSSHPDGGALFELILP